MGTSSSIKQKALETRDSQSKHFITAKKSRYKDFYSLIESLQAQEELKSDKEYKNTLPHRHQKILVGDTVLLNLPHRRYSYEGYCHGVVLGIGQFVSTKIILYSIKMSKPYQSRSYYSNSTQSHKFEGKIALFFKHSIVRVLKRNYDTPHITINDRININGDAVIVKYIGRRLLISLKTDAIDLTDHANWSRWEVHEHKDVDSLYCDDVNIYYACETIQIKHANVEGIRYFFNNENDKSYTTLVKESDLRNFRKMSPLKLLIDGYLRRNIFMPTDISQIIKQYIPETTGFIIKQTCTGNYSYGTCPTCMEITEYNAYNINGNIYGPTIIHSFTYSYKSIGKTSKTIIEGLYSFECNGECGPRYAPHPYCSRYNRFDEYEKYRYEIEHWIPSISDISINKMFQNDKCINGTDIMTDIAKAYDKPEEVVLKEVKKNKIRLHGLNHNPINLLSDEFTAYKSNKTLTFKNEDRIKYIYERDKDRIVCFNGEGMVLMADNSRKQVCKLRVGDEVMSFPNNISTVVCCVVSCINNEIPMVKLINENKNEYFWITHKHPIMIDKMTRKGYDIHRKNVTWLKTLDVVELNKCNLEWVLPINYNSSVFKYEQYIYNFILNENHSLNINGFWCCTLGHNFKGDVIEHELWGNYKNVTKYLKQRADVDPNISVFN